MRGWDHEEFFMIPSWHLHLAEVEWCHQTGRRNATMPALIIIGLGVTVVLGIAYKVFSMEEE